MNDQATSGKSGRSSDAAMRQVTGPQRPASPLRFLMTRAFRAGLHFVAGEASTSPPESEHRGLLRSPEAGGFGTDTSEWRSNIDRYLRVSSPEGYEAIHVQGGANFILEAATFWGQRYLNAIHPSDPNARLKAHAIEDGIRNLCARLLSGQFSALSLSPDELQRSGSPLRHLARIQELPVLTYADFDELVRYHRRLSSPADRDAMSVEVIQTLTREPEAGRLLTHAIFGNTMGREELYLQALGALHFGAGRTEESVEYLKKCVRYYPSELNYLCLFNALRSEWRMDEAFEVIEDGIDRARDPYGLTIAYAAAKFSVGEVQRANEIFETVRDRYIEGNRTHLSEVAIWNERVNEAIACGQHFPDVDNDVYTDNFASNTWWNYWYHFNRYGQNQHAEGILDKVVPQYLTEYFNGSGLEIRQLLEVGTMCAEPLFRLAQRFPDCEFIGIDRQPILKENNERAYRRSNLRFVADDIAHFLETSRSSIRPPSMLLHVRTSPFFYPAGLQRMYEQCAEANVEYIALVEHYGVSKVDIRFVDFELMSRDGEARARFLTHHNYKRTLQRAKYEIIHTRMLGTYSLLTSDGNSIFLVARRTG